MREKEDDARKIVVVEILKEILQTIKIGVATHEIKMAAGEYCLTTCPCGMRTAWTVANR